MQSIGPAEAHSNTYIVTGMPVQQPRPPGRIAAPHDQLAERGAAEKRQPRPAVRSRCAIGGAHDPRTVQRRLVRTLGQAQDARRSGRLGPIERQLHGDPVAGDQHKATTVRFRRVCTVQQPARTDPVAEPRRRLRLPPHASQTVGVQQQLHEMATAEGDNAMVAGGGRRHRYAENAVNVAGQQIGVNGALGGRIGDRRCGGLMVVVQAVADRWCGPIGW